MGNDLKHILQTTIKKASGAGAVDLSQANPEKLNAYINASPDRRFQQSGVAGNRSIEPIPKYRQAITDKVSTNGRNAWMVLTTDRPGSLVSGHGGRGETQCGAIDLVVGRMAAYVRERDDEGKLIEVNPDFKVDAARIYISQKADIDDYFECAEGKSGNSIAQSAIAVKADDVRLIARRTMKLITGTDQRDSQAAKVNESSGIELIANNDDKDMQPIVKGNNLVDCLGDLGSEVGDLAQIVESFLKYQKAFNEKLLSHTHFGNIQLPQGPRRTSVAFEMQSAGVQCIVKQVAQTELSLKSHQSNMETWKSNYLKSYKGKYINSIFNKTN